MALGTPLVTCCGRPLVWVADDEFWTTNCGTCGRVFSFFEPHPLVRLEVPRRRPR